MSEADLIAQLEQAPLTIVTGVVGASAPGGGKSRGDVQWTMTFKFVAWRQEHGPLKTKELIVRKKVSDKELDWFAKSIKPDSIIRIRARVLEENIWHRPEALLDVVIGKYADDSELNELLSELKNPVVYKDARFGELTLDRRFNWFRGTTNWVGEPVTIHVDCDDADSIQAALANAHELWSESEVWNKRIKDRIERDLLSLKNENWLDEDEQPLSKAEFEEKLTLDCITVRADGSFNVSYDDGNMFLSHAVVVNGSLREGVTSANLFG